MKDAICWSRNNDNPNDLNPQNERKQWVLFQLQIKVIQYVWIELANKLLAKRNVILCIKS